MSWTIQAEMVASVHSVIAHVGESVAAGQPLVILESMKMEIPVVSETAGVVDLISVVPGDVVQEGDVIAVLH
jgi:acetyl-CoA carboxylase biotin carboxyl carrier protein